MSIKTEATGNPDSLLVMMELTEGDQERMRHLAAKRGESPAETARVALLLGYMQLLTHSHLHCSLPPSGIV